MRRSEGGRRRRRRRREGGREGEGGGGGGREGEREGGWSYLLNCEGLIHILQMSTKCVLLPPQGNSSSKALRTQ